MFVNMICQGKGEPHHDLKQGLEKCTSRWQWKATIISHILKHLILPLPALEEDSINQVKLHTG